MLYLTMCVNAGNNVSHRLANLSVAPRQEEEWKKERLDNTEMRWLPCACSLCE